MVAARKAIKPSRLTAQILGAMLLGFGVGYVCHLTAQSAARTEELAGYFSSITDLFLRLIKMVVAPLVFSTLVAGIASMGGTSTLGRIGLRTLLWFMASGLVSLILGLAMVQWLQPGVGMSVSPVASSNASGILAAGFTLQSFVEHLVPSSIVDAMARNEILQIVVFSLFAGGALAALGERAATLRHAVDALVLMMLQITEYVMRAAPAAAFAAIAAVVTTRGPSVLLTVGKFMGGFYLSLLVLWMLLGAAAYVVLGRQTSLLFRSICEPLLVGFATASSEAAYPKTLERLEQIGIPKSIAAFVLPLGYSFNLAGSMMYCVFALMFVAQAYDIHFSWGEQTTILLFLMVSSKGLAGVPRSSLVVVAAALLHFKLPEAGLLLILGVDQFLDMGRTATNVLGNSIAAAVVAKWEGVSLADSRTIAPINKAHKQWVWSCMR